MALAERDDVVDAFPSRRPDDALRDRVRLRAQTGVSTVLMPIRRARAMKAPPYERSRSRINKRGRLPPRGRFDHRLPDSAIMTR